MILHALTNKISYNNSIRAFCLQLKKKEELHQINVILSLNFVVEKGNEDANKYTGQLYLEKRTWKNYKRYNRMTNPKCSAIKVVKKYKLKIKFECKKNNILRNNKEMFKCIKRETNICVNYYFKQIYLNN
jgi:hypothetical protein